DLEEVGEMIRLLLGSQHGDVELCLPAEVAGDHRGVDAGTFADVTGCRTVVPPVGEQIARRLQQAVTAARGVAAARELFFGHIPSPSRPISEVVTAPMRNAMACLQMLSTNDVYRQ